MHGKREQKLKSSRSSGEAILVGKFGPMPRTAKLHRLSIAIAEPLHSEIASTSPVCDCAKGIEMHKDQVLAQDGLVELIPTVAVISRSTVAYGTTYCT